MVCRYGDIPIFENKMDIMNSNCSASSTFQKGLLQLQKGIFLENENVSKSDIESQEWSIIASCLDGSLFHVWLKQESSIFGHQRLLSTSLVRILYEKLGSSTCHVQKVILKVISSADACETSASPLVAISGLMHRSQRIWPSKEMTKMMFFPHCVRPWDTQNVVCTVSWWYLVLSPFINEFIFPPPFETKHSLALLNLTENELLDESVKLLHVTLRHLNCFTPELTLKILPSKTYCKDLLFCFDHRSQSRHIALGKKSSWMTGWAFCVRGLELTPV